MIYLSLAVLFVLTIIYLWVRKKAISLPPNAPSTFLNPYNLRTIAFLGDSLTHGTVSANYLQALKDDGHSKIIAGINSDLSLSLLQRLEEIFAHPVERVVIMIGSNDLRGIVDPAVGEGQVKSHDLNVPPSFESYEENLRSIIDKIKSYSIDNIFIISPPVMNEDLEARVHKYQERVNSIIKMVAQEKGLKCIPLYEEQCSYLRENNLSPKYSGKKNMRLAIIKKYLFRKSWDEVSHHWGYHLLTDGLHLNNKAAEMMASQLKKEIFN